MNILVRDCYAAIKEINPTVNSARPFGIWQKQRLRQRFENFRFDSYSLIYSDPIAWIKGGYLDFIAPQIYWQFTTSVARFDVLVRWWNAVMSGHESVALHHPRQLTALPNGIPGEIPQQVELPA